MSASAARDAVTTRDGLDYPCAAPTGQGSRERAHTPRERGGSVVRLLRLPHTRVYVVATARGDLPACIERRDTGRVETATLAPATVARLTELALACNYVDRDYTPLAGGELP